MKQALGLARFEGRTWTGWHYHVTADGDDSMCDVLSVDEFTQEMTGVLLAVASSLTGDQILQIRQGLVRFGKNHGWTEG
jgi:SRSO17 transposase